MNIFRRLLLGSGRLPEQVRSGLVAEGVVVLAEGLPGSITYRNYRAPGRFSSWRKVAITGAVAVTARRLVVWDGKGTHINVPLDHPLRAAVTVSVEPPDTVVFGYDPSAFDPAKSGQVEVRLRTPRAAEISQRSAGEQPR